MIKITNQIWRKWIDKSHPIFCLTGYAEGRKHYLNCDRETCGCMVLSSEIPDLNDIEAESFEELIRITEKQLSMGFDSSDIADEFSSKYPYDTLYEYESYGIVFSDHALESFKEFLKNERLI